MIQGLSQSQIQKLSQAGIKTQYELITNLPFGVEVILPFGYSEGQYISQNLEISFFLTAQLIQFENKKNNFKNYLLFQVKTKDGQMMNIFYFGQVSYVIKDLVVGQIYQFLLKKKGDDGKLWSSSKFVILNQHSSSNEFILGKAVDKVYFVPKYSKMGILQSPFFRQVHTQLQDSQYLIPLQDLVPSNSLVPMTIDLKMIHKPQSIDEFKLGLEIWQCFMAFLRLNLIKFLEQQQESKLVNKSEIDLIFLKKMVEELEYELSDSQKKATWEILNLI